MGTAGYKLSEQKLKLLFTGMIHVIMLRSSHSRWLPLCTPCEQTVHKNRLIYECGNDQSIVGNGTLDLILAYGLI